VRFRSPGGKARRSRAQPIRLMLFFLPGHDFCYTRFMPASGLDEAGDSMAVALLTIFWRYVLQLSCAKPFGVPGFFNSANVSEFAETPDYELTFFV
jgi:hypothetical protein